MCSKEKTGDFHRWPRMIIAFLILLSIGLIYAWSVIRTPLIETFPMWNVTKLSGVFSISMIFFILGGLLGGWLQTRWSPKACLVIGAVLIGVGFYGASFMDKANPQVSLIIIYVFYGVLATLGVGFAYNACITVMVKWFPENIGMASGALLMAFGIGAFLLGSTEISLIELFGVLNSFKILAVFNFILVLLGAAVIRLPQEHELQLLTKAKAAPEKTLENHAADNNAAAKAKAQEGGRYTNELPVGDTYIGSLTAAETAEYSPRQMLRNRSYQLFFLWSMCIRISGLTVINSAATITLYYGAPAMLGLIVTLANGAVRPIMGGVFDKLGRRKALQLNMFFAVGAAVLLLLGAECLSIMIISGGLVLAGLGYGSTTTISASYVMSYGKKNYSINVAITNFAVLLAALLGPLLSGLLQDSAGGNYISTFVMMLIFSCLSVAVGILLMREESKK